VTTTREAPLRAQMRLGRPAPAPSSRTDLLATRVGALDSR
jgi:hypothetical protein